MSCTRKGIRFSKPSNNVSVSMSGSLDDRSLTSRKRGVERRPPRIILVILRPGSDESLVQHRVGNLEEARDVRTVHEISESPVGLRCLVAVLMDRNHDLVQPIIYLFAI